MERVNSTNQGESSTQDNEVKKPFLMATPDNIEGNESGPSTTAGYGAPTGKVDTGVEYSIKDVNQTNDTSVPYINITASTEDLGAKWQNREQDQGAGANQYQ